MASVGMLEGSVVLTGLLADVFYYWTSFSGGALGFLTAAGEIESQHLYLTKKDLLSKENGQRGYT